MILTTDQLLAATGCSPVRASTYAPHFAEAGRLWAINTPGRWACFLAQVGHESEGFGHVVELLSYSAERLAELGRQNGPGSRWAAAAKQADRLARNPQALANFVYADRNGNGDEASGDGWRFKGRGLIQITGYTNYLACSRALCRDDSLVQNPEAMERADLACRSAGWYWDSRSLNSFADAGDFETITRKINGGLNGQSDRLAHYERAKKVLGGPAVAPAPFPQPIPQKQEIPKWLHSLLRLFRR
jgi:putative chitinase